MSKAVKCLRNLTGWDKNPGSVFWVAIPLAILGLGLLFLKAIISAVYLDNFGYLITIGILFLIIGYPVYGTFRNFYRMYNMWNNDDKKPL